MAGSNVAPKPFATICMMVERLEAPYCRREPVPVVRQKLSA